MRNRRALQLERVTVILVLVIVTMGFAFLASWQAYAADDHGALLAGTVKSESGDKMSGVTVSAKAVGSNRSGAAATDKRAL